jgi:hypothetical protein
MPYSGEQTEHAGAADRHEPPAEGTDPVDEAVMELLADHVPLTLLVDLVDAPPSEQVLVEEGLPEQRWWEQDHDDDHADDPGDDPARG